MNETALTLNEAIALQPTWLRIWVGAMVATHLAAVVFLVHRADGRLRLRPRALAILLSFFAAGALMTWLHTSFGYTRILGLAHLVFWTPVWIWVLRTRTEPPEGSWFGRYLHLYLFIAGISLVVDAVDLVRWLAGDRAPLI